MTKMFRYRPVVWTALSLVIVVIIHDLGMAGAAHSAAVPAHAATEHHDVDSRGPGDLTHPHPAGMPAASHRAEQIETSYDGTCAVSRTAASRPGDDDDTVPTVSDRLIARPAPSSVTSDRPVWHEPTEPSGARRARLQVYRI